MAGSCSVIRKDPEGGAAACFFDLLVDFAWRFCYNLFVLLGFHEGEDFCECADT